MTLLFYDEGVYKVGDRKKKYVSVTSLNDIKMLNKLQLSNCNEVAYFQNENDTSYLVQESHKASFFRRPVKSSLQIHKIENKPNSELIQLKPQELKVGLQLTFLRVQKKAKMWLKEFEKDRFQPAIVPRDVTITNKYQEYRELSKRGIKHPLGFVGFLGES